MNNSITVRRAAAFLTALCIALLCTLTAFADNGELSVLVSGLKKGQTDVSKTPKFSVTFSDNVSSAAVIDANKNCFLLTDSKSNDIPLEVTFTDKPEESPGNRIVTVTPKTVLTPGEAYVFTIKASVTSDSGYRLKSDEIYTFTVAADKQTTSPTTTLPSGTKQSAVTTTTRPAGGNQGSNSSAGTTGRQSATGSGASSAPPVSTRIARSVRGRPSGGNTADKTTKAERTTREITTRETTTRETATRAPETTELYTAPEIETETVTRRIVTRPDIFPEDNPITEDETGLTYNNTTRGYAEPFTEYYDTAPSEYPNLEKYYKEEEPTADNSALPFVIIAEVALIALPVAGLLYLLKRKSSASGAEAFIPQEEAAEEAAGDSEVKQEGNSAEGQDEESEKTDSIRDSEETDEAEEPESPANEKPDESPEEEDSHIDD